MDFPPLMLGLLLQISSLFLWCRESAAAKSKFKSVVVLGKLLLDGFCSPLKKEREPSTDAKIAR